MQVNLLTSNVLTSKALSPMGSIHKGVAVQIKSDLKAAVENNARLLHQNPEAANSIRTKNLSSFFLDSAASVANDDGTYTVDGVSFAKKEFEHSCAVLQAAVSGIETSGTIDYINYAQMSIANNAIQAYGEANLSEDQADVLCRAMQEYIDAVISTEGKILSDGSYITSGAGDSSEYYCIQKTYSDVERKAINDLIDEMNRVSGRNKAHVGSDFTARVASATNQTLIQRMSNLFTEIDLADSVAVDSAMEQYKTLMEPVYLASGINNEHGALTRVLNSNANKLSAMINRIAIATNNSSIDSRA